MLSGVGSTLLSSFFHAIPFEMCRFENIRVSWRPSNLNSDPRPASILPSSSSYKVPIKSLPFLKGKSELRRESPVLAECDFLPITFAVIESLLICKGSMKSEIESKKFVKESHLEGRMRNRFDPKSYYHRSQKWPVACPD